MPGQGQHPWPSRSRGTEPSALCEPGFRGMGRRLCQLGGNGLPLCTRVLYETLRACALRPAFRGSRNILWTTDTENTPQTLQELKGLSQYAYNIPFGTRKEPVDGKRTVANTFSGPPGPLGPPSHALSLASVCTGFQQPAPADLLRRPALSPPEPLCPNLTLRGWRVPGSDIYSPISGP